MKQLVGVDIGSYSFNASTKSITLSGLSTLKLEDILLITNVTSNKIIYQFNSHTLGGTISSNIITLTYDTTGMSNTDSLQIFIEYPAIIPVDTYSAKSIVINNSSNNTIHTPASGKAIRLHYVVLSADGSNGSDVTGTVKFSASGSALYTLSLKAGAMWQEILEQAEDIFKAIQMIL